MAETTTTEEEVGLSPTLAGLLDGMHSFSHSQNPDELVRELLKVVAEATQSSWVSLMLVDEDDRTLFIKAAIGLPADIVTSTRVSLGEGIVGRVARCRRPLMFPDGSEVPPPSVQEEMLTERIASSLCVPLETNEHLLGVLNLARQHGSAPFATLDLWLATLVADRIAAYLHTARLYDQLENRERFITRIMESIPSSLVVIDHALRIVSVNRNFLEKIRRREQDTLGGKIQEVFPQVLVNYARLDRKVRQVFRSGEPLEGGKVAYRAPGLVTRIYYYRLFPLKVEETVENVMLLMDDITEREQLGEEVLRAERHLASVVECANDLVVSMDPEGRILTWNWAAETISGHKAEETKGQLLLSFCAAEQRPVMVEMLSRLADGEVVQSAEVNLMTDKGQEVPIAWNCSPMRDDTGQVVGLVAVGRDLTERRRLEAQLIQSAKMASMGVMAGGIAHELRNPLGIISASAQLLQEKTDDPQLRDECAHKIHSATKRASLIIENLLKFARPKGEQMREVDLRALLEETLALLDHQIHLQKVKLSRRIQRNLPSVHTNPELLQQVFTNLILNACNSMPQGGVLTVTTRASTVGQVEIRFCDTGRGIPPEHLPNIFDPFFTTMPVGKGIGLGLSICYSIIQQNQGAIEVESEVGQGTTFTIRLPCAANGR